MAERPFHALYPHSEDLHVLFLRYLDEELEESELAEFNTLLAGDDEIRREFIHFTQRAAQLREVSQSEGQTRLLPGKSSILSRLVGRKSSRQPRRQTTRSWMPAAIILVFWVVVGGGIFFFKNGNPEAAAPNSLTLLTVSGDVKITGSDGRQRTAEVGAMVTSTELLHLKGMESSVTMVYDDQSELTIIGPSSLKMSHNVGKRFTLHEGTILATVVPQPTGSPMVIETPQARVDVLGTEFTLSASDQQTDLEVSKGKVKLTRIPHADSVVVTQGKRVHAERNAKLKLQLAKAFQTWEEDLENGLPPDWQFGKFVKKGLPPGSKGGVEAEFYKPYHSYIIAPQRRWIGGLSEIQKNTHLNFTFKLKRKGWVNLFCLLHTQNTKDNTTLAHCGSAPFWQAKPETWYTMTVPVSAFKRRDANMKFTGPPPKQGEQIYDFNFSTSEEDRGLVLDHIWITQGGPGKIMLSPWKDPKKWNPKKFH